MMEEGGKARHHHWEHGPMGPIAVSADDVRSYGCPHCGFVYAGLRRQYGELTSARCAQCHGAFIILAADVTVSPLPYVHGDGATVHPTRAAHPFAGIPARGLPDRRPVGGEYFISRSFGIRTTAGCFVCGGSAGDRHAITALAACSAAGERIRAMVGRGVALEPHPHEPLCTMVVVGACSTHQPHLDELHVRTHDAGGIISTATVAAARELRSA